jgi:two-component system osmolarity sensor histidine kinase EnvZ
VIRRLGIVGRLLAIGALGFGGLLIVLGALLFMLRAQEGALERHFPLPEQVAAIVELLDRTPQAERTLLLSALNTAPLSVTIGIGPPTAAPGGRELSRLDNFLSRFDPQLASRELVVDIPDDTGNSRPLLDAWSGAAPLRVQAALADGNHVSIEAIGVPARRVLGLPSGFWLAAVGLLIATVTLVSLFRTARPLQRLTVALETFSDTASPVHVEPAGPADLRRLIGTFNRMQERLSTLLKGRTMLAGAISHDLRTYLTRLRLRVDAIEDPAERAGAGHDIDEMSAIIENSLAFAQSASSADLHAAVDLAAIVRGEVECYRGQGSAVASTRCPDRLMLRGDAVGLRRVVTNLVDNALRYAGEAEIGLAATDGFAELLVDDHGRGIPKSERQAIFEPFYRLDTSRNLANGGSGLGLALTRQIVEAHGGRVTAGDAPHGGTRMRVLLPLPAA